MAQHLFNLRNQGGVIFLISHLDHDLDILIFLFQFPERLHFILQVLGFPDHPCGLLRVIPESRLFHGFI